MCNAASICDKDIYIFTFSHLADAFIQSDLQERALQKVRRSMIINNTIAPNIVGSQNMKHTLWKANKCQREEQ